MEKLKERLDDYKVMKNMHAEQRMMMDKNHKAFEHLEIMMARDEPLDMVLRLLCL
jgi:hypothetical protein